MTHKNLGKTLARRLAPKTESDFRSMNDKLYDVAVGLRQTPDLELLRVTREAALDLIAARFALPKSLIGNVSGNYDRRPTPDPSPLTPSPEQP